jgi:hypothetical protein
VTQPHTTGCSGLTKGFKTVGWMYIGTRLGLVVNSVCSCRMVSRTRNSTEQLKSLWLCLKGEVVMVVGECGGEEAGSRASKDADGEKILWMMKAAPLGWAGPRVACAWPKLLP